MIIFPADAAPSYADYVENSPKVTVTGDVYTIGNSSPYFDEGYSIELYSDSTDDINIVDSGTCGDNLTWTLTEDGTLTISGTGEMDDYDFINTTHGYYNNDNQVIYSPWGKYTDSNSLLYTYVITHIDICSGVTSIGDCAFAGLSELTSVNLPETVTIINPLAFSDCTSLSSITMPDSITFMGSQSFYRCINLTSVVIPENMREIGGSGAFAICNNLTNIIIPKSVTSIGYNTFEGCSKLTIYGEPDSYAQSYANENGIPFIATTD